MGNQSSFQILFSAGGNVDMQVRMSEEGRVHLERNVKVRECFLPWRKGRVISQCVILTVTLSMEPIVLFPLWEPTQKLSLICRGSATSQGPLRSPQSQHLLLSEGACGQVGVGAKK